MAKSSRSKSEPGREVWPWGARVAVLASGGALLALLIAFALFQGILGWPRDELAGWVLLGVVLLALVPIYLILLDMVFKNRVNIKAFGVALSFAEASKDASSGMRLETVDTNLTGDQSQPLERTGLPAITRALRRSSETDVLVVDLREGSTWWEGRLFILLAGAAYRDRPRAIAFVADLNGKRQQFIGWGSPRRLVDLHARKVPAFARALATASARIRQWEAGDPVFAPGENDAHIWRAVQIPGGPIMGLPSHPDDLTDPRYAFELFLAAAIDPAREPLVRLVTRARLMELYDSSLVTDNVPVGASDRDWASVLRGRREFFAVTSDGRLQSLVPRDALVSSLVSRLVQAGEHT